MQYDTLAALGQAILNLLDNIMTYAYLIEFVSEERVGYSIENVSKVYK